MDDVAALAARFLPPADQERICFGLERINKALAVLDQPQTRLPTTIHICGTNGKGSTAAHCRAIAEAAGLSVHVFSSPHLIRLNERIRLAGTLVTDEALQEALERAWHSGAGLTWFEAITVAAFCLFAETPADLCLIETGAGGALDATNALTNPALGVVTPITIDHEEMFGVCGLAEIARVKAGIFRSAVPAVIARQAPEAEAVLLQEAAAIGTPLLLQNRDWRAIADDAFSFVMGDFRAHAPDLALAGAHQIDNAGLACAALRCLETALPCRIEPAHISAGLARSYWPARLQPLGDGPVRQALGRPVTVDGAHNQGGAEALAAAISAHSGDIALVLAVGARKDARAILHPLAGLVELVIACPLVETECVAPSVLVELATELQIPALAVGSLEEALQQAGSSKAGQIYIAGSLHLAGAVLAANAENLV